ncbi:MerR family transcriptional regulator [Paenibacillus sp. 1P07SE]|uniref:MerR family transcriptional regulator n=1 Tax=Paenibacillus sp. 1P07SE TaxID=3132209 RepID=UPI0039A46E35
MKTYYSMQEVAQLLGLSKDTLRYYDRIALVSPSREENRYRRYAKDDLIDLMNIQIMQYADFSLEEIRRVLGIRKLEQPDPSSKEEAATFLDAKYAATRQKIAHLEKVSQLLSLAAGTLRNLTPETDHRLAGHVREMYKEIRTSEQGMNEVDCDAQY